MCFEVLWFSDFHILQSSSAAPSRCKLPQKLQQTAHIALCLQPATETLSFPLCWSLLMSTCDSKQHGGVIALSVPSLTSRRADFQNVSARSSLRSGAGERRKGTDLFQFESVLGGGRMLKLSALSSVTCLSVPSLLFSRKSSCEGRLKVAPPPPSPP